MSLPKNASKAEVEGQAMIEKIRQRYPPSEVVEYGRGLEYRHRPGYDERTRRVFFPGHRSLHKHR